MSKVGSISVSSLKVSFKCPSKFDLFTSQHYFEPVAGVYLSDGKGYSKLKILIQRVCIRNNYLRVLSEGNSVKEIPKLV